MRIARVFLDIDMRMGHDGLVKVLNDHKVSTDSLAKGSLIIFLNRKGTAFKMLAGKDYVVAYKNGSKRIPLEAIRHLPTYFNGTELQFAKAVEKSVLEKIQSKRAQRGES